MNRRISSEPSCFDWKAACAVFILCAVASVASRAQTFSFNTVHQFDGTDGAGPYAGLVQATDGNLYGTTVSGGNIPPPTEGTVFKITPGGTLTSLVSFCRRNNCSGGENPQSGLIQAADGNLYGTAPFPTGTVFRITTNGRETVVSSSFFAQISGGLVQGTDGNFYGTTGDGGPNVEGTVFKITPSGTLTTLYTFCSQSGCTDGKFPGAGLVQGTDGNFYGTATNGGFNNCYIGCGTIFKITPSGTLTTLYSFCPLGGDCADGN